MCPVRTTKLLAPRVGIISSIGHNETEFSHEVIEMALGHTQSGVVRAYWRKYPVDKIKSAP
jgi:hypothetical protein